MAQKDTSLGVRIKARRTDLRMTQRDLATKLNVSLQSVSDWETGRARPWENIVPLARALEVPIEWLLTGGKAEEYFIAAEALAKADLSPTLKRLITKLQTLPETDHVWLEGMIDRLLGKTDEGSGSRKTRRA